MTRANPYDRHIDRIHPSKREGRASDLEDRRIGGMYLGDGEEVVLNAVSHALARNLMRSGMVTGLVLAGVLVGLAAAYRAHMRGKFHKLKAKIADGTAGCSGAAARRAGGDRADAHAADGRLDAGVSVGHVVARAGHERAADHGLYSGQGRGEAAGVAFGGRCGECDDGQGADADGQASLAMGGAFEAPWAGSIWGTPSPARRATFRQRGGDMRSKLPPAVATRMRRAVD